MMVGCCPTLPTLWCSFQFWFSYHIHMLTSQIWTIGGPTALAGCDVWMVSLLPSLPLCPCSSPTSSWRRGTSWAPFSTHSLTTTVSLIRTGPLSSAFYSLLNDATFAAAAAEGSRDGRGQFTCGQGGPADRAASTRGGRKGGKRGRADRFLW